MKEKLLFIGGSASILWSLTPEYLWMKIFNILAGLFVLFIFAVINSGA